MGKPTTFVIRTDTDELDRWRDAAEEVAKVTRAAPNVSALIKQAMDEKLARMRDQAKEKKGGK